MSKFLKILTFMLIILEIVSYSTNLYAVNMNLGNNTSNTNSNTTENTTTNTTANSSTGNEVRGNFTTQITVSTQELTISNALSICLIAVGIVIILLAIGILIKLKK